MGLSEWNSTQEIREDVGVTASRFAESSGFGRSNDETDMKMAHWNKTDRRL